jgi:hypothetical protein
MDQLTRCPQNMHAVDNVHDNNAHLAALADDGVSL